MRIYDTIVLLDSEMPEDGRKTIIDDVEKTISASNFKVVKTNDWGVKKLAYRIDHRMDAQYFLFRIEGSGADIGTLDSKLHIMDGILRYRIVRQPEGDTEEWLDFKDYDSLRRFLSDRGKMRTRHACRVSRRNMALATNAIKQARELALLPYVSEK